MRGEIMGLLGLVLAAGLGGCAQTAVVTPPKGVEMLTYSAPDPKIQMHATIMMVPTRVLETIKMDWQSNAPTPVAAIPRAGEKPGMAAAAHPLGYAIVNAEALTKFVEELHGCSQTLGQWEMNLAEGQPATAGMTESQNYMKSVEKSGDKTTYHPQLLKTGVTMELAGTTSPDGKSVMTRVHPIYVRLDGMDTFTTEPPGRDSTQVPKLSSAEIDSTVAIPTGQTIIFAGPKMVSEVTVEAYWPIWPFKNHSYLRDDVTMVVIVQPAKAEKSTKLTTAAN